MKSKDWDKIANDYFEHISSPFENGASLPIEAEIKKISLNKRQRMIVCDAGCGIGNLIPLLSKNFKQVTAFDFSKGMVENAKKRFAKLKNVDILQQDMTDLKSMKGKFDCVFSVNSMIMPSAMIVDKAIVEVHDSLKKNGKLIAVMPSLESVLYESMLVHDKHLEKFRSEKIAAWQTKRKVGAQYYDFYTGLIDIEGKQKHFYQFEIEYRLKKAGFKNIKITKALYPWDTVQDMPPPTAAKDAKVWDWFVTAEK